MNENLAELVCVLDRSGSMLPIQEETISGFNAFVDKQKEQDGDAKLTLVLFDDMYELVHDGVSLEEVPKLTNEVYFARGYTALLDAVGRTIDRVGERLAATVESERPGKVLVMIMTDGAENRSSRYSLEQIQNMVEHQQSKYNWEFVFLGANIDAFTTGARHGYRNGSMSSFDATEKGTRDAFSKMSRAALRYRSTGTKGDVDEDLSDEDTL